LEKSQPCHCDQPSGVVVVIPPAKIGRRPGGVAVMHTIVFCRDPQRTFLGAISPGFGSTDGG